MFTWKPTFNLVQRLVCWEGGGSYQVNGVVLNVMHLRPVPATTRTADETDAHLMPKQKVNYQYNNEA